MEEIREETAGWEMRGAEIRPMESITQERAVEKSSIISLV